MSRPQPWPLTWLVGQVRNREAEALGAWPWGGACLAVVLAATLAAFPFVNDKFTYAVRSTNPALYPGLTGVFEHFQSDHADLKVAQGRLVAGPGVAGVSEASGWTIVVESAGGRVPDPAPARIAFFGERRWSLVTPAHQFEGTWSKLEGFTTADLNKVPLAKLQPMLLFASATGDLVPTMAATWMLMFVQVVFLTVVLGFLLSLSKVQIAGTTLGARRGVGFAASLRTTAFLTVGPGLVVAVALSFFSGASALSWVVYTLLIGLRIVVLYMGRFNAKPKGRPGPGPE